MKWPARILAGGRRIAAERAYLHARAVAARSHTPQPASWWGLCAMLSSYQLHHATLRPLADLWSELLPFLHIPNEALATILAGIVGTLMVFGVAFGLAYLRKNQKSA